MKPGLELLEALGYEEAGPDPDDRTQTQWTYQKTLPHLVISLPREFSVLDVHYAIVDAGRKMEWQSIREAEQAYARRLRDFGSTEIIFPPVAS